MKYMNVIKDAGDIYKFEGIWREDYIIHDDDYDQNGQPLPWPEPTKTKWNKNLFVEKLHQIENMLIRTKKFIMLHGDLIRHCIYNDASDISKKMFFIKNYLWSDCIIHYVMKHNYKPSDEFINLIMITNINYNKKLHIPATIYVKHPLTYLKINENQMMIMDALMYHGGLTKKYIDSSKTHRYSEHSGLIDFDDNGVEKIIISGHTNIEDADDKDIFLPENMPDAYSYEYFFHTHPPTPKPGGRAKYGVLYEFPSISDIIHFIEHYNNGLTQGSMVITSEGIYIIRKLIIDNKRIKISNTIIDNMEEDITDCFTDIQGQAIAKYGTKFNNNTFYSQIAQDFTFIKMFNKKLKKYGIYIEYVARKKDKKGRWYLGEIHVPVFVVTKK